MNNLLFWINKFIRVSLLLMSNLFTKWKVTAFTRKDFDFFEITSTISVHTDCLIKLLKSVPFGEVRILRYLQTMSMIIFNVFNQRDTLLKT
jgi:hypothetical protein